MQRSIWSVRFLPRCNADRLHSYNMSPDEIVAAITAANVLSPSGNMPIKRNYPMMPLHSVVTNIHDLETFRYARACIALSSCAIQN